MSLYETRQRRAAERKENATIGALVVGIVIVYPFLALVGSLFSGLILGLPVMWLLGWLHQVPDLSFIPPLGFWPSVGLVALIHLLFGSSRRSSSS